MRALLALGLLALVGCGPQEVFQPFIHVTVVDQEGARAPDVDTFEVTLSSVLDGNPITDVLDFEIEPGNALPTDFVVLFSEQVRGQNVDIVVQGLVNGVGVFTATTSATADVAEVEAVARFCGDQTTDEDRNETCDDGPNNSDTLPDACRTTCEISSCGDLVVDTGETCDDGNTTNEDGCNAQCQIESCGDGVVQANLGETCDDGNTINNDGCDADCLPTSVIQVSAGQNHTCALLRSGSVRCWGRGGSGQLGYGDTENVGDDELPFSKGDVNVGGPVAQISAGGDHTCALLTTGSVRCWGSGVLGYENTNIIGDDEEPASAGDINIGGIAVQISAGFDHTCALLNTGNVRCWGAGNFGRLGYGDQLNIGDNESPASKGDVSVGGVVTQIAAGGAYTCALLSNGSVRCWGSGELGKLGYGNINNIGDNELPSSVGPVSVDPFFPVTEISTGFFHTCAILTNGKVRCWGNAGALGLGNSLDIGDNELPSSVGPVNVGGDVAQITTGANHTCVILNTGEARCWGLSGSGQLGYGNTNSVGNNEDPATAGNIDLGGAPILLDAGNNHTCALLSSGVRCWGDNTFGQLGYGNTLNLGDNESILTEAEVVVF